MMKTLSKRNDWQKTFGPKTFQPKGSQQTFFQKKDFQLNISQQVSLQPKHFWKKLRVKNFFCKIKLVFLLFCLNIPKKLFFSFFSRMSIQLRSFLHNSMHGLKSCKKNCFTVAKLFQSSPPPLHRDHKIKEQKNLKELCLGMEPPPP